MSVEISVEQAKADKLFYVVANVVVVNTEDETCLILKRDEREIVLPGKWAYPGGKLEHKDVQAFLAESGNTPIDGVNNVLGKLAMRETKEETGLIVSIESDIIVKNNVFVRPDNIPVMMFMLVTKYVGGEVVPEAGAFTDYRWVHQDEFSQYDYIPGMDEEAAMAFAALRAA